MRRDTPDDWQDRLPPDDSDLLALVDQAIRTLPGPFRAHARNVAVQIADFAPDAYLDELQVDDPFELTGLYDGVPLQEKQAGFQPTGPDTIWLFRRPILDEWIARGDIALDDLVAHVYLHELAHHFGWSDDDIEQIAPWRDMGD